MVLNVLSLFAPTFLYMGHDPMSCSFLDFCFSLLTCLSYRRTMDGRTQPWLQVICLERTACLDMIDHTVAKIELFSCIKRALPIASPTNHGESAWRNGLMVLKHA
jgi:hypothetical protein